MSTRKILRAAVIAAAFVGAPAIALAQPHAESHTDHAGNGDHGDGDHGGGDHGAHHADPSKDFNWVTLSYRGKDARGGKMGDGKLGNEPLAPGHDEEPMSAPFVLMLLNFGILLIILAKVGGPAARKMAESRSDEIKTALDEAAKLRKEAQEKLAGYSAKLAASEAEMDAMLKGMRADAEADKQRILANAEVQAAAVKRDAELRIAAEIERARFELSREVANAAAVVAEKLLREKTTATDQTGLVDAFVRNVEAASTAAGRTGKGA